MLSYLVLRMDCQELENLLYPYLDGELEPSEAGPVEEHLGVCASCRAHVQAEQRTLLEIKSKLKTALSSPEHRAPDPLRARIESGLRREASWAPLRQATRYAAAAALVVAIGATVGVRLWPDQRRAFLEDAVRRHAKALPPEIRGEHALVEAWFGGKLDHRINVPRFPNAVLSGARISNVRDKPAAYIAYDAADPSGAPRRIGLFVIDDPGEELRALPHPEMDTSRGYNVALWRDGEIVYELVSDLGEADIRQMLSPPVPLPRPLPTQPNLQLRPASHVP